MASRQMAGKIILLNGASSSGKSSLAKFVQATSSQPFWHYSIDHLNAGGVLPRERIDSGEFLWSSLRESFFEGFHRSIPAFAEAGNNLLVEHIIEDQRWMDRLLRLLAPFDVFFVGLHCPLEELERRELARGDRRIGEARSDFAITHSFGTYDFDLTTAAPVEQQARALLFAWSARSGPSAFAKMLGKSMDAGRSKPA
jgi:chloramphenicol 3-O phosphotransferase